MKQPLVSIVILNLNGLKDTFKCISSLNKTNYLKFEVIVIDNGSLVNEAGLITKKFGRFVKTYRLNKNLGFTGGNNWALKKTRGKYIVLLNNDTVVDPHWLSPLVSLMESDKQIAVAQPKIRLMQRKSYFDYAGAAGGFIDKYGYPFTRGRIFNTQEKDKGQYDGVINIFWASGAACIIRKSIIKRVGGLFSKNLFNYMEEIDFCWRIWNAGYRVVFTSNSIVYHKGAATAKKNLFKKRYWEHRNNLLVLTMNLSGINALKIMPIRVIFEIFTYFFYITSGQYRFAGSLFLAHIDFLKKAFFVRLLRKGFTKSEKFPIYLGSIVIDYFVKNKRHFKSLNWSPKGNVAYLLYSTKNNTGGKVVFEHANKLVEKGYKVTIYTLFGKKPTWFPAKCEVRNFVRSYFDMAPDVLVATFWPTSYLVFLMKAKERFYFSQDWEEDFYNNHFVRLFARLTYTLPIKKIVISKYLKKRLVEYDKTSYPTYHVDYAVLDTSVFKPGKRDGEISKRKKVNILSVISWYNLHKGPDILVKAVKELKSKRKNYHFTLVSREPKPYGPVFDKFVSNPKLKKLARIYQNSDIFLITSRSEGFFIPGLEAMACGCLVITTNCGGILDYVINKENSIILNNIEDLWENDTIEKLLINKKLKSKLIRKGYKTAKKYEITNIIKDIEKIYFHKNQH